MNIDIRISFFSSSLSMIHDRHPAERFREPCQEFDDTERSTQRGRWP